MAVEKTKEIKSGEYHTPENSAGYVLVFTKDLELCPEGYRTTGVKQVAHDVWELWGQSAGLPEVNVVGYVFDKDNGWEKESAELWCYAHGVQQYEVSESSDVTKRMAFCKQPSRQDEFGGAAHEEYQRAAERRVSIEALRFVVRDGLGDELGRWTREELWQKQSAGVFPGEPGAAWAWREFLLAEGLTHPDDGAKIILWNGQVAKNSGRAFTKQDVTKGMVFRKQFAWPAGSGEQEEQESTRYYYVIDLDERGEFSAHVEDAEGKIIWNLPTEEAADWFEQGWMKHKEDIGGLESYLADMGILQGDYRLLPENARKRLFRKPDEVGKGGPFRKQDEEQSKDLSELKGKIMWELENAGGSMGGSELCDAMNYIDWTGDLLAAADELEADGKIKTDKANDRVSLVIWGRGGAAKGEGIGSLFRRPEVCKRLERVNALAVLEEAIVADPAYLAPVLAATRRLGNKGEAYNAETAMIFLRRKAQQIGEGGTMGAVNDCIDESNERKVHEEYRAANPIEDDEADQLKRVGKQSPQLVDVVLSRLRYKLGGEGTEDEWAAVCSEYPRDAVIGAIDYLIDEGTVENVDGKWKVANAIGKQRTAMEWIWEQMRNPYFLSRNWGGIKITELYANFKEIYPNSAMDEAGFRDAVQGMTAQMPDISIKDDTIFVGLQKQDDTAGMWVGDAVEDILRVLEGSGEFVRYGEIVDALKAAGLVYDDVVVMQSIEEMEVKGIVERQEGKEEPAWKLREGYLGKSAEIALDEVLPEKFVLCKKRGKIQKKVKFRKFDMKKGVVMGEVYVPGEFDTQDDGMSRGDVVDLSYDFMLGSRQIGKNHIEMLGGKAAIVESFIAGDGWKIDKDSDECWTPGAWVLGTKLFDDGLKRDVKEGRITGYSIGGEGDRIPLPRRDPALLEVA